MSDVPVVRVLAPFLREVRTCTFGPQKVRLLLHVIAGLGDPFCSQVPVNGPDVLAVAVRASVLDEDLAALLFGGTAGAEDIGGPVILGYPREKDRNVEHGRKDDQASSD
jgi:hypothetical protein